MTLRERFAPVYTFLANKWYFDELIDFVVVRPALWLGRFTESVLERIVIGGTITGGTLGVGARRFRRGASLADRIPALLRGGDGGRHVRRVPLLPDLEHLSR